MYIYINTPDEDEVIKQFPCMPKQGDTIVCNYKYYIVEYIEYEYSKQRPEVDVSIFLKRKEFT